MLARAVVEAARDRHKAFTRQHTPDALLLRHLSREQRRLLDKIVRANPNAVADSESIELATYDFDDGFALPAHQWLNPKGDVIYTDSDLGPFPLFIRSWDDRHRRDQQYYAGERAGTLYLFGTAEDWQDVESVTVSYVPLAPELVAMSTPLVIPDSGEQALAALCALFMAGRGGEGAPDPNWLKLEAREAEDDFLRAIGATYRATTFRIRQVR